MFPMAQRSNRSTAVLSTAALCCAMGLVLGFVPASVAGTTFVAVDDSDFDEPEDVWLVDDDIIEPLIASGVFSRTQAQLLMASYNVDSRLRASILLSYQRQAEQAVAKAHGMTIAQYQDTPMRKLPRLTKAQKARLNQQLTTLATELRTAMATSNAQGTQSNKRSLKVVPAKPKR